MAKAHKKRASGSPYEGVNSDSNNDTDTDNQSTDIILHSSAPQPLADYLDTFTHLTKLTPRDQNGFLTYFLEHSVIPPDYPQRPPSQQTKLQDAAKIPLNNLEGYPAFDFSKPVWNQLPHEPDSYYTAFRAYLLSPARDLSHAQEQLPPGFTPFTLREAYILFYWNERARAYDLLKPVAAARLKDQRLMLMEDQHYTISQNLLRQLNDEVKERTDEQDGRPWQGLQAVDLFKSIIAASELQRTALGLPVKGPKLNNVGHTPAPLASIDRNIREAAQNYVGAENSSLTQAQKMRQQIDRALAENPEQAAQLQQAALDILLRAREQSTQEEVADPGNPHASQT